MTSRDLQDYDSSIPDDYVRFILLTEENGEKLHFYLQIPLDIIDSLCLRPRKYLVYLGWCILGVEGTLGLFDDNGDINEIDNNGGLTGGEIYIYLTQEDAELALVDLDAIKTRTNVASETTASRNEFQDQLLQRDSRCVWTGLDPPLGQGTHIIPYKQGSDWLRLVVESRPNQQDDVAGLDDINDIRNGVFVTAIVHMAFDQRLIAVLKTPNQILDICDIPPRHDRDLPDDVRYPRKDRYTLQWLSPLIHSQASIPNNSDAAFTKSTRLNKPSALLLHYTYGATAVRLWGHGLNILEDWDTPPRPPTPESTPVGPSKQIHDRRTTVEKLKKARHAEAKAKLKKAGASKGPKGRGRDEGKAAWDEDDVMLFFWGNTKAAKERYIKTREAKRENMELWRQGVESAL